MTDADPSTALRPDTAHALLARIARAQAEGRAPSLAAGVFRDGALAWSGARGTIDGALPTSATRYRIGSITKPFTAVLVMRLRDEGRLRLTDRLDDHVPGTPFGDRTIRDLLAHAGGIAAEPPGPWWERSPGRSWEELVASFSPELVLGPPGIFHYSNPGYAALGELVARHRGTSWLDALQHEILDPLGLTGTSYGPVAPHATGYAVHPFADVVMAEQVQDLGGMAPAGQLWSTVEDLARFGAFLAGETGEVLDPSTMAEMRQPQVIAEDKGVYAGYGLGVQVIRRDDRELVGHGGSVPGFVALLFVDVERRTGFVELANTTAGPVFSAHELLEIVQEREPAIPSAWRPVDRVPADLLDAVGVWHWGPSGPYVLKVVGTDALDFSPAGGVGRGSRFVRRGGDWIGLHGYWVGERLRFVRRPDGTLSHVDLATFVFTRTPYEPRAPIPGGIADQPWPVTRSDG